MCLLCRKLGGALSEEAAPEEIMEKADPADGPVLAYGDCGRCCGMSVH